MGKYSCEKCGKEFNQKSHYTTHSNKKNPCIIESKIEEMITHAVKEKLLELKKSSPNDLISNIIIDYTNKLVKEVSTTKIHIPKPILKWVGGKTQILDKLISDFPIEINNYREIFLGGGSVLLTLLCYVKSGIIKIHNNIYAYDLNEPLIYVYKNIQTHHNELYNMLQTIITEFNECGTGTINRTPTNIEEAKIAKENYYYWIRSEYNKLCLNDKKSILGSAMFIFLNKTCFRGVFRVGPNGFNVPYGHYKNPEIINKEHLEEIADLIQNVVFECCDFTTSLTRIEPNDFVYLDPPYAPETSNSFVGYTENGFNIENHNNLFKLIHNLTDTNKKIMLSNADVDLVRENFCNCAKNEKYSTLSILCKRSINSKNPDAKAKEVIIKNY
jgi:DNA adenine methylase